MKQYLEAYKERSVQIRALSMPPEYQGNDAKQFYQQFVKNYSSIKELLLENRSMLDRNVYYVLKQVPNIAEADADLLLDFSDHLADTRTLEMVDVRLAWFITSSLEPYYLELMRSTQDIDHTAKYIHCLYRCLVLAYNVVQMYDRGRQTDSICQEYWDCIQESMDKATSMFLDDPAIFAALPAATRQELMTMELFRATAYERLYYDETMIRKQIACYQRHIQRLSDPRYQRSIPSDDLAFDIFSAYAYLTQVHEFLYWRDPPRDILLVLDEAVSYAIDYIRVHPDNHRVSLQNELTAQKIIGFYLGRTSIQDMLDFYVQWTQSADPHGYDYLNLDANLLPFFSVLWMCRAHRERIDECRQFLLNAQRSSFEYIHSARDQGAYHTLQRFSSYILADYVDLKDGVPFLDYYTNLLVTTQPTLYIHCYMTFQISRLILSALYNSRPELLIGCCGCKTLADVTASIDNIHEFLYGCCIFHDIGKMFFLDTINLYNRMLFPGEFEIIKVHPSVGHAVLQRRESTRPYAEAALYHHKWYDDKGGYPNNVSYGGVENAILYQIITCSDCIDAATDSVGRTYSTGKTIYDMVADMRVNAGRMFNPDLVALFDQPELVKHVDDLLTNRREKVYYRAFRLTEQALDDLKRQSSDWTEA